MRAPDWLVVALTLLSIVAYGLRKAGGAPLTSTCGWQ